MAYYQPLLIAGYRRCDNCGRDTFYTRKAFQWYVCAECWILVTPQFPPTGMDENGHYFWKGETEEQRRLIGEFFEWRGQMEDKYPLRAALKEIKARRRNYCKWRNPLRALGYGDPDQYYPFCACGNRRKEMRISSLPTGLFGGPYSKYCAICEAKKQVETVFRMADKIAPGRDDEEWLDLMQRSHPEAFEVGVLPEYWFKLREERLRIVEDVR